MSKIDWDRPLEAYHPDGRSFDTFSSEASSDGRIKYIGMIPYGDCPRGFRDDGVYAIYRGNKYGVSNLWRIRNVTEPKADAFDTAFREGSADIPQWAWDRMKAEYIEKDGMAASFARYVMTKEEAPVDPDLIAAREVVCGYHHDKHPESPWHMEMAEQVRSGDRDGGPVMLVAYHAIKRGRELERGEGK